MYRRAVARLAGWELPGERDLNLIFAIAACARLASLLVWSVAAAGDGEADWLGRAAGRDRRLARRGRAGTPAAMKCLIVNGDDFGASHGVNVGVIEAHDRGILTSTSMMVDMPASAEAGRLAARHPAFGVGLHVVLRSAAGPRRRRRRSRGSSSASPR